VHLDTIESFIYPTDAQSDCSTNVKIYIKIYMRGASTCFGFSTTIIRELLTLHLLCTVHYTHTHTYTHTYTHTRTHTHVHTHTYTHTNKDWINMKPLDQTDSVNNVF